MERMEEFFALARERHAIYLRRGAGRASPWTDDPIFRSYRFCNVFRELDTTTAWFRQHVREPLRARPEVLLATLVFRLFNRITTGEAIFKQCLAPLGVGDVPNTVAWDSFLADEDTTVLKAAVKAYCGDGPYVTGSYMIRTPAGMDKIDGVVWIIEQFLKGDNWRDEVAMWQISEAPLSLAHAWLMQFPYIGGFTAYEVVSDLRHTALLEKAPDINSWAHPGPGASRGLNHLFGETVHRAEQVSRMHEVLFASRLRKHWPAKYPVWEMREVEHWLCEYYKYVRFIDGGQAPKQLFRSG